MITYEIDTVNYTIESCPVTPLKFHPWATATQKAKQQYFYFRTVFPSGGKYEQRGLYLYQEDCVKAAQEHCKQWNERYV